MKIRARCYDEVQGRIRCSLVEPLDLFKKHYLGRVHLDEQHVNEQRRERFDRSAVMEI